MAGALQLQSSFTAGELDPGLAGRIDVTKYYAGAELLRNVLVRPQGGVRRRPGMAHLTELPDGLDGVRLVPFAFNTEQTYCLALTAGMFRVWLANGTLVHEQAGCPWNATQASQMNYAQSADTLLLFHPDVPPQRIRRGNSHDAWTRDAMPYANLPTHDYGAVTPAGTITPSATSGTVTLTASQATFTADHVGWQLAGNQGRARITAVASATSATADVLVAQFKNTDAFADWSLEEPVMNAARGWPECGTFHAGRLWLGGFRARPATLMASVVADFWNFDQGTGLDDQAMYWTIGTDQVNAIHQMISGRTLQILTSGSEHVIATEPPITPTNIYVGEQTRRGIKRWCRVCEVDGASLFIQAGGAALRQFLYDNVEDAYRSDLLSLLAAHLIKDPVDMAARKGQTTDDADHVLLVNPDGTISVLTTLRAQEVAAFSRWETAGQVRAVAALLSGEVFFATVRGGSLRVELWDEARLLDSGALVTGTDLTSISGLAHCDGLTLRRLLDGADNGIGLVTNGTLALPLPAARAEVGLDVPLAVTPMPAEPRHASGALIGRKCRLVNATARVRDTGSFAMRGQPVLTRTLGLAPAPTLGSAPPVQTTDVTVRGLIGWQERHSLPITQDVAAPFELLALSINLGFAA